jgi:hypothetical protein
MNERINNLIDQSGFGSYAEIPDTYIVHKNDLAEFAELIVRECLSMLDKHYDACVASNDIKEHFGVE